MILVILSNILYTMLYILLCSLVSLLIVGVIIIISDCIISLVSVCEKYTDLNNKCHPYRLQLIINDE